MNSSTERIDIDDDCPELTKEQAGIIRLVLSHSGVRGKSRAMMYYQGMEEERVHSLRNLMSSTGWSLKQALEALKIPEDEYGKYEAVI